MIKKILVLICIVLIISCSKDESIDFLTNGTWILDNGFTSTTKESVKFKSDKTYVVESRVSIASRLMDNISGTITGNWTRNDNKIDFLSSIVSLPDDTCSIIVRPTMTAAPMSSFYGYLVSGIYKNDSSLISDSGSIHFNDLSNSEIFHGTDSNQRIWTIIKLTKDSLIINTDGQVLRYFKE